MKRREFLPRALLVKMEGCDGDANAFYEKNVITVCYEYNQQLWNTKPEKTTPGGVAPIDAVGGPLFDTCLHEFGHALFDMLRVPVFGREEDAADQVSGYIILHLGKVEARRLIGGHRLRVCDRSASHWTAYDDPIRKRARHARATLVQCAVHRLRRR